MRHESAADAAARPEPGRHILRFHRSERSVHWAIAIPFLVCWVTAVVLVLGYNPAPDRPFRIVFAWTHRISGLCFAVLPAIAILRSTGEIGIHLNNVRQAWIWTLQDVRWLAMLGLAAVFSGVRLPEQGKFNAAEKLNFMVLMAFYPLYLVTGATIWLTHGAFVSWVLHFFMAVVGTPLVLGHIYMATINPSSRVGLSGMISGYVDRQWAKHHYRRWYREQHGPGHAPQAAPPADGAPVAEPAPAAEAYVPAAAKPSTAPAPASRPPAPVAASVRERPLRTGAPDDADATVAESDPARSL